MNKKICLFKLFLFLSMLIIIVQCIPTQTIYKPQDADKYYDIDSNEVKKWRFQNMLDYSVNIDVYKTEDSKKKGYIINRFTSGILDSIQYKLFKAQFAESLGISLDYSTPMRLIYYFKVQEGYDCLEWTRNLAYTEKVSSEFNEYQTIYVAHPNYKFDQEKYEVYTDQNDVISDFFSKTALSCKTNIIINTKGEYGTCLSDGCEYFDIKN